VFIDDYQEFNPTSPPAAFAAYGYNLDDQLTLETLLGGTRSRTYTTGRLTNFSQNLPGAVLATSRSYDTTGRIGTETTGTVTSTYGYDAASQLKSVTPSTGAATVYTYDKLGRRLTSKAGTAAAVTYTYDTASQLTAIGTNSFTYDPAGRRLTDTITATNKATYTYDQAGRLATISRVNSATATTQTRAYTPSDLLASVSNLTGTTTTATGIDWDTALPIAERVDFVSTALTDLVNGPGGWASDESRCDEHCHRSRHLRQRHPLHRRHDRPQRHLHRVRHTGRHEHVRTETRLPRRNHPRQPPLPPSPQLRPRTGSLRYARPRRG
jgi:YD repeat-containing protein